MKPRNLFSSPTTPVASQPTAPLEQAASSSRSPFSRFSTRSSAQVVTPLSRVIAQPKADSLVSLPQEILVGIAGKLDAPSQPSLRLASKTSYVAVNEVTNGLKVDAANLGAAISAYSRTLADFGPEIPDAAPPPKKHFSYIKITGSAGNLDLSQLRKIGLDTLDLSQLESLTDTQLSSLASHCPGLISLNIANSTRLTQLTDLPLGLQSLDANDCNRLIKIDLRPQTKLTQLNLAKCPLISDLSGLPKQLTHLNLSRCFQLTQAMLNGLDAPQLKALNLAQCEQIDDLSRLPKTLENLDLSVCHKIDDAKLAALSDHTALHTLNLKSCMMTSLVDLPPNIAVLGLKYCSNLDDVGVSRLAKLPLTELDLSRCWLITHLNHLPASVRKLDVSDCRTMDDDSFEKLADLKQLQQLNLSGNVSLTDNLIGNLCSTSLQDLQLRECTGFTDAGLVNFAARLPNLQTFNLSGCSQLHDAALSALPENLTSLTLQAGANFSAQALDALRNRRPPVEITLQRVPQTNWLAALGDVRL